MPSYQGDRVHHEIVKQSWTPVSCDPAEGSRSGKEDVGQGPAPNHAVVGKDQHAGQGSDPSNQLPILAGVYFLSEVPHGIDRRLPPASPQHHLGHHHGNAQGGDAQYVHENKGAPAMLTGEVGKLPDVA